jgi:hypothetical protein
MFRFTIRDVLWLTALIAMGAAWWADRARIEKERALVKQREADVQELRQLVGGDPLFSELIAMAKAAKALNRAAPPPQPTKSN